MKKTIVWILIIILIVVSLYFYLRPAKEEVLEVKTAKVERSSLSKIVSASGNIKPERKFSLDAGKGDIVDEILKKVGDEVKKEDILIKFKNGYELKSPIGGVVLEVKVVEEEKVGTIPTTPTALTAPSALGMQAKTSSMATTPMIVIADFDPLMVETEIEETDIVNITKEQKAKITLDAYPDKELLGKIIEVEISPISAMPGEASTYSVRIEITESKGIYPRAGLSCDVEIEVETKEDILYVSYEAVFKEENKYFVFEVENEAARKTEIKIGLETEDYYEIIEGLEEGDMVIVSDLDKVVDGQQIKTK